MCVKKLSLFYRQIFFQKEGKKDLTNQLLFVKNETLNCIFCLIVKKWRVFDERN